MIGLAEAFLAYISIGSIHGSVSAWLSAHDVLGYRGSWMSRPRHRTGVNWEHDGRAREKPSIVVRTKLQR